MTKIESEYLYIQWDGGDAPYEVVLGHVGEADARSIVDREGVADEDYNWEAIEQKYARWVPTRHSDFDMMFHLASGPARGAFPVTLLFYE